MDQRRMSTISSSAKLKQTIDECERLGIMSQQMQRCKWMKTWTKIIILIFYEH